MVTRDQGSAEMIGAIVLTGIIAIVIGIIGAQWIGQIPTSSPPYINIEIGCGNGTGNSNCTDPRIPCDFSCRTGMISCDHNVSINYGACKNACPAVSNPQYKTCMAQCEEQPNCVNKTILSSCNMLFICHNGGDSLNIDQLSIRINGKIIPKKYDIYENQTTFHRDLTTGQFKAGEVMRLPITEPPNIVIINYQDYRSGNEYVLVSKKF